MGSLRIMITGASGQLGHDLIEYFGRSDAYDVIGLSKEMLDITNTERLEALVEEHKPDILINSAALTKLDVCEEHPALAYEINSEAVKRMAKVLRDKDVLLVQISTDYVYYGELNRVGSGGFIESEEVNPQSIYGKSKALAEQYINEISERYFILRTSWLYGRNNRFVNAIIDRARNHETIQVVGDQYGSPTSTFELFHGLKGLLDSDEYGLYHACCHGECSRYEFARAIIEVFEIETDIEEVDSSIFNTVVKRPHYSALNNRLLIETAHDCFSDWREAFEVYIENFW